MRGKKTYIVLIAILLVFLVVMFLIFGLDEMKARGTTTTLIVGDDTVWYYSDKTWSNISSYGDFNWKKYDVYLDNIKNGNYYLWYNDKWYAFNDNKKAVKLEGEILAIDSTTNVTVSHFSSSEIDDYSYVYRVLKDNKLPTNSQYTVDKKIALDYDNDGEDEDFYIISNVFSMDFYPENLFSIVFMVKNEEIYPIYTKVEKNEGFNGCKPYISGFVDVNNDSKSEIILSCSEYSVSGISRMLYEYKNNEFKMLIYNNR